MARFAIEVLSGQSAGRTVELDSEQVRIGQGSSNELVLDDAVGVLAVRIVPSVEGWLVEDVGSAFGTLLERHGGRSPLDVPALLEPNDVICLGGEANVRVRVKFEPEAEPQQIVELKPLSLLGQASAGDDHAERLNALLDAQRALGAAEGVDGVVTALADLALGLVPRATHATVALCEDRHGGAAPLVTVTTRVRHPNGEPGAPVGPVLATKSILRKVVRERAAVLAADAASEAFTSESMLGASIRSTIGVPLWKGDEILGALQLDNRALPGMFQARDVDALGVLAAAASLAVANARLIARLELAEQRLSRENQFLKGRERARSSAGRIVGDSRAMHALLAELDKVADTRVSVLVEGETGSGKELVAAALHYRSRRHDRLFVAQNCAAFPEQLLESELFGHKRGAFTGAAEDRKGLFEVADGGTLFLDEVGEMPLGLQAKLLRVLQDGEVRPVGATQARRVDVRIVAATHRNLEDEVARGRFREDLFYRLRVFPLRVPPLRERREDIPELARFFLERYTKELGKPVAGFTDETLTVLTAHGWPGNVRELENEIQRLVIQVEAGSFITPELVSSSVQGRTLPTARATPDAGTLKERVEKLERMIVLEVLAEHSNNKTSAAKTLGITREGLHKKMKSLGIG